MKSDNHTNVNNQVEGIQLAHTLVGEHVGGSGGVTHAVDNIQPAGIHSQAPYKKPARRSFDNPNLVLCLEDDCASYPMSTSPYCNGHARARMIIAPTCHSKTKTGDVCRMPAMKDQEFCYNHAKAQVENEPSAAS